MAGRITVRGAQPASRTTLLADVGTLSGVEVGLYAGSFDPVHLGHIALIEAASELLDRVIVVVAVNSQKQTGMFPVGQRVEMLSRACQPLSNVQVAALSGLLIDIAQQVGATVLVRSAGKEHAVERQMAYLNGCEGLRTVLIPPDPKTAFISSSQVRGLITGGALGDATKLVPAGVADSARANENGSRRSERGA